MIQKMVVLDYQSFFSIRKEVLYNILIAFGVHMKPVRLIKICSNEIYSKICAGKYLFDPFPVLNSLKKGGCLIANCFPTLL